MRVKKEVDIVLMIVFLLFFAVIGYYLDSMDKNGIPLFPSKGASINVLPGAEEIEIEKEMLSPEKVTFVELKNTKFIPDEISIKVGTTVCWVNKDPVRAYLVYDNAPKKKFYSRRIMPYKNFCYTFEEKGVYNINDAIFTYMHSKITVE